MAENRQAVGFGRGFWVATAVLTAVAAGSIYFWYTLPIANALPEAILTARQIDDLFRFMAAVGSALYIFIFGYIVYFAIAFRAKKGDDPNAISASAKRGEALFFGEQLECFHCHGGFNFTGSVDYLGKGFAEVEFHDTGLYNLAGRFSYPESNLGLYEFTRNEDDIGKFKAPTLRNIAVTAPYVHDGSVATLEQAVGHQNPGMTAAQRATIVEFLRTLTDEAVLNDPKFAKP